MSISQSGYYIWSEFLHRRSPDRFLMGPLDRFRWWKRHSFLDVPDGRRKLLLQTERKISRGEVFLCSFKHPTRKPRGSGRTKQKLELDPRQHLGHLILEPRHGVEFIQRHRGGDVVQRVPTVAGVALKDEVVRRDGTLNRIAEERDVLTRLAR